MSQHKTRIKYSLKTQSAISRTKTLSQNNASLDCGASLLTVYILKNKLELYHQRRDREGRDFSKNHVRDYGSSSSTYIQNREEDVDETQASQNARDRSLADVESRPAIVSSCCCWLLPARLAPVATRFHTPSSPWLDAKTAIKNFCLGVSVNTPRGGSPLPRLSLCPPWLSSSSPPPTESPPPRFHPTRKQEFVVKFPPCACFCGFLFLPLPCSYGPLIRSFVDLGKRRCGGRPAAIWRGGYGRREGADRGQVPALRWHGYRAHQVRSLHHSLLAQGVHPRSVAAR